jgi:hypothetical protein
MSDTSCDKSHIYIDTSRISHLYGDVTISGEGLQNLCYSHTQPDFKPGPYGIKTRIDPHRNLFQFLGIP